MRRLTSVLSVLAMFMVSFTAAIAAQEASPPAAPMDMPTSFELAPGVVADNVIFAEGAESPASYRLTFAAGVIYEVMPSPNLEVVYMESGSMVLTLDMGVTVFQLGDTEGAGEHFAADTEITLEAGDYLVMQPGVGGEVRNDSDEPAAASVSGLMPVAPGGIQEATPEG